MTMGIAVFLPRGLALHTSCSPASDNRQTMGYGFILLTVLMLYLEQSKELFPEVSGPVTDAHTPLSVASRRRMKCVFIA